jgi:gluconate 2-dehydrogenase alpha chain
VAKKLPKRTVVIVGGGLCAGLVSRQLTEKGVAVVVLERGVDHTDGAESRLPNQRDELRWDRRQGLMQNWQRETYTLRHSRAEQSLPRGIGLSAQLRLQPHRTSGGACAASRR